MASYCPFLQKGKFCGFRWRELVKRGLGTSVTMFIHTEICILSVSSERIANAHQIFSCVWQEHSQKYKLSWINSGGVLPSPAVGNPDLRVLQFACTCHVCCLLVLNILLLYSVKHCRSSSHLNVCCLFIKASQHDTNDILQGNKR